MTVRELKEALEEYDEESEIYIFDNSDGYCVEAKEIVSDDDGDMIITFD